MEARKLQLTGGSTYTVSLPKSWARERKLSAGDTIFIEPVGDVLVLHPRPADRRAARTKRLRVAAKERREHVLRKLIGAYVTGHRLIELQFPAEASATVRSVAREFSRMVIGAEIVEDTGTRLVVQDLADPMELSPDRCLRRMHLTVRSMVQDSLDALLHGATDRAADVPPRDEDVDRLYWMVAKQYHLAVTDPSYLVTYRLRGELHHFRIVAKALERMGDHGERIASAVLELKGKAVAQGFLDGIEKAGSQAVGLLDRAFSALMAGDLDAANEAVDGLAALNRLIDGLFLDVRKAAGEEALPLGTIVDSISRIGGYATDIAEVAINHVVGQEG